MNQQEINNYYRENNKLLTKVIKGILYKKNKKINIDIIINESYIHVYNNIDSINNEDELQRMILNFINKSIIWTNSKINKQERLNDFEFNEFEGDNFDQQDIELINKINIEKWYDDKQCLLQMYRQQETDKVKQIIFDCFFIKKITKGVDLASHLKVNKDYACKYIRTLKNDIKEFAQNEKNK
jgi:hypothetical protein